MTTGPGARPGDSPPPAPDVRPDQPSWAAPAAGSWPERALPPVGAGGQSRTTFGTIVLVLGIVLAGLVLLGAAAFSLGLPTMLASTLLAAVPFVAVTGFYLWLDRYEPHPRAAVWLALAWGAFVSTALAGVFAAVYLPFGGLPSEQFLTVVQAPIVEELLKGAGVVLIARRWPAEFHSMVDGLVIAGLVGAGFAFTENILYFGAAMLDGRAFGNAAGVTLVTFLLRGLASPFAHSLFTSATGLGVARAESRRGSAGWGAAVVGLLVAMALHALWNGAATSGQGVFLAIYVVGMVPLFVGAKVLAVRLRRSEGATAARMLGDYVPGGALLAWEPAVVSSLEHRRQHAAWARGLGQGAATVEDYQQALVRLAHLRERAHRRTSLADDGRREQDLLAAVHAGRPRG